MSALTLEPEYWLVLAGLMRDKPSSSSSDIIGGPEEMKEKRREHGFLGKISKYTTLAEIQGNRHLFGAKLFPDCWRQIHHHLPLHCSSHLTVFSGCLCRTGPKVWSQFVSWGSQGAGVRPDQFLLFGRRG